MLFNPVATHVMVSNDYNSYITTYLSSIPSSSFIMPPSMRKESIKLQERADRLREQAAYRRKAVKLLQQGQKLLEAARIGVSVFPNAQLEDYSSAFHLTT